jgi:hypothetical protein
VQMISYAVIAMRKMNAFAANRNDKTAQANYSPSTQVAAGSMATETTLLRTDDGCQKPSKNQVSQRRLKTPTTIHQPLRLSLHRILHNTMTSSSRASRSESLSTKYFRTSDSTETKPHTIRVTQSFYSFIILMKWQPLIAVWLVHLVHTCVLTHSIPSSVCKHGPSKTLKSQTYRLHSTWKIKMHCNPSYSQQLNRIDYRNIVLRT